MFIGELVCFIENKLYNISLSITKKYFGFVLSFYTKYFSDDFDSTYIAGGEVHQHFRQGHLVC